MRFLYCVELIAILLTCSAPLHAKAVANVVRQESLIEASLPVIRPIMTNYDIYIGGLHLVEAHILFQEDPEGYHIRLKANTRGVWDDIIPWNTVIESRGTIVNGKFLPREYYTRDDWNHKPRITRLHFGKDGTITPEFDPPSHDDNRNRVTDEQKKGALDPITALLDIMAHITLEKNCNVTTPIFDGKRRFDITGVDQGERFIDEEDYGVYKGSAHLCQANFKMISGDWKDREHDRFWQKNDKEQGRDPFDVYLAKIGLENAEVPIRLETRSIIGIVMVHLSSWHYASPGEAK